MSITAMKMALEALELSLPERVGKSAETYVQERRAHSQAITALRQAVEQADMPKIGCVNHDCDKCKAAEKQEPVAWFSPSGNLYRTRYHAVANGEQAVAPLYTTPPKRKPLTDEEIEAKFKKCGGKWDGDQWMIEDADLHPFVRSIESPDMNVLREVADEYNAWIRHHAAGHTYDDFLVKQLAAHGIKE
jgi:hypothetical protein